MSPTVRVVPSTAPRCSAREVQVSPVHVLAVAERLLRCAQDLCAATASAAQGESVPSFSHRISRRTRLLAAVRRTPRCRRAWEAGMSLPDGSAQQEVEGGDRPMRFNVAVRRLTPRIPMTAPLTRAASCACGQFWHDNSPRSASTGQRQSTCSSRSRLPSRRDRANRASWEQERRSRAGPPRARWMAAAAPLLTLLRRLAARLASASWRPLMSA